MIIETDLEGIRDPFILLANGIYYAYGTGWVCYKNTSKDLRGPWTKINKTIVTTPQDAIKDHWAPEVYFHNGKYYMFTTYYSSQTNHRGCSSFVSDSPEGPFTEISNGHFTPKDKDSIDATLYVDENGRKWTFFVHEWTCTPDSIGRMSVAEISNDLTRIISKPIDLFRADSPDWSNERVTDGCYLYRTKNGTLLMIWSNFSADGYCVGIASSDNGRPDGKWTQHKKRLFSKTDAAYTYDGGHGMIFKGHDKRLYLSLHSPNSVKAGRKETMIFIPLIEKNDTLECIFE